MLTARDEKLAFLQNLNRGVELLKKGCELGSQNACYFLSGIYLSGSSDDKTTIQKDMNLAAKYSKLACDSSKNECQKNILFIFLF